MYTDSQIELIVRLQQEQLAAPCRAVVNCESAFVSSKIMQVDNALGQQYWSWVCKFPRYNTAQFGPIVEQLEHKLHAIDKQQTMPAWGYSGT